MTVEMENCRVLVSDQKIEQMKDILPVLEQITRQNQPLLIVTEDITGMSCRPTSHGHGKQMVLEHLHLAKHAVLYKYLFKLALLMSLLTWTC